jgi:hypothetical protein
MTVYGWMLSLKFFTSQKIKIKNPCHDLKHYHWSHLICDPLWSQVIFVIPTFMMRHESPHCILISSAHFPILTMSLVRWEVAGISWQTFWHWFCRGKRGSREIVTETHLVCDSHQTLICLFLVPKFLSFDLCNNTIKVILFPFYGGGHRGVCMLSQV